MATKLVVRSFLVFAIVLIVSQLEGVRAVGSKTYETNNGFPTNFLNDIVNSGVVKKKMLSRWKWEVWDVVPGTHAEQIYVFNITNPDEVEKGGKPPVLQQLGPYYYREYRFKFGVSMNLDLSVNYVRNFSYTFDPTMSKGMETDLVNTVNIPFVVFSTLAAKYAQNLSQVNQAISELIASGETIIKRKVPVGDLLFHGMDVTKYQKYLNLMGPATPLTEEFAEGSHSILKLVGDWGFNKNGVHEGLYTVDSGLKNEKTVGTIILYNEKDSLTYWEGESCNKLEGTDGSVFPPKTQSTDVLKMLEVDLCRSVGFEYEKDMQYKSVMGQIFKISGDVMGDTTTQGDNCFCRKGKDGKGTCLKKGLLDVSSCQFDAPYVMSYAHFLNADPEYLQAVSGLKPDPAIHQTQLTIEPVTGAVITFHKRFQWNVWIKPLQGLDYFKQFHSLIVPILWNDDTFNLDPDKEELLMEELASLGGGGGGILMPSSGISSQSTDFLSSLSITLFILVAVFIVGRAN